MKTTKKPDAMRANFRKLERVERDVRPYRITKTKQTLGSASALRITPLGGQNGIGEKNMIVLEYGDDALVLDCGFELGINLPGINYAIPATDYLATIKHKLRGYVISHGHMDHIGALVHVVPGCPAPIYGSRFTTGMVEAQFEKATETGLNFAPETQVLDMDAHERVTLGSLTIELIRVTHAIPESSAIVVDTPAGRVINTGDFRLDPEPLDDRPSDIERLRELGDEGVLLLMSESTNSTQVGRTPTEHTLQDSFYQLIENAQGRVFISIFSSNMNRIQMIVNAAHAAGRKVALDGRSMVATAELAVRLGNLKIPKGTFIAMRQAVSLPDDQLVIVCTGGQGEPGAAMSRMAVGEHQYIKLKPSDTVVISSTPIPGNEQSYQQIGNDLASIGVTQFRHPTHTIDGCGPLHVSGHGNRDEQAEMIKLVRPQYLLPIYGGRLNRHYHRQVGLQNGLDDAHILMADNGDVIEFENNKRLLITGRVTSGAHLVDRTGSVVPEIVTKDRLLLQDDGFMVVTVTIDRATGRLLSSPDIITRGAIAVRDSAPLMDTIRREIRASVAKQASRRVSLDTLRQSVRNLATSIIYQQTGCTPIVISVVTTVDARGRTNVVSKPVADA